MSRHLTWFAHPGAQLALKMAFGGRPLVAKKFQTESCDQKPWLTIGAVSFCATFRFAATTQCKCSQYDISCSSCWNYFRHDGVATRCQPHNHAVESFTSRSTLANTMDGQVRALAIQAVGNHTSSAAFHNPSVKKGVEGEGTAFAHVQALARPAPAATQLLVAQHDVADVCLQGGRVPVRVCREQLV